MTDKKHIDELVVARRRKRSELVELGAEIASSARPIAVAFVDLADSTALKHEQAPEEWLGYVFDFVQQVDQVATAVAGTIVKRIGDELMITFADTASAERFINSAATNDVLAVYRYKIAVDFGDAYHFRFSDNLADDPYGPVVDRCARIAKLVSPGAVLTTRDYITQLGDSSGYISAGRFLLKGLPGLHELFVRSFINVDSEEYLAPLIATLNSQAAALSGYRFQGRKFSVEDLRRLGNSDVRPFIARELINVPKLPLSFAEAEAAIRTAPNISEKEQEFYGYLVEWVAPFETFERHERDITVILSDMSVSPYSRVRLRLPPTYLEIVKQLKTGQRIRARGIISGTFLGFELNYVDFDVLPDAGA